MIFVQLTFCSIDFCSTDILFNCFVQLYLFSLDLVNRPVTVQNTEIITDVLFGRSLTALAAAFCSWRPPLFSAAAAAAITIPALSHSDNGHAGSPLISGQNRENDPRSEGRQSPPSLVVVCDFFSSESEAFFAASVWGRGGNRAVRCSQG